MADKLKLVFIGTPEFAVPSLVAFYNHPDFEITLVITQPDRPSGRNNILKPPAVKQKALELGLKVVQPENINNLEFDSDIDFIFVAAYAQLLKKHILNLPKFGVFNLHASLLPKYRGAACIQAAILNGDRETGVSIFKLEETLDTGDIYFSRSLPINDNDDYPSLYAKLAQLGAQFAPTVLKQISQNEMSPKKQNDADSSYSPKIKKEDGRIDWRERAELIKRKIQAYSPWPGTWTEWNGKKLKITQAEFSDVIINDDHAGKVVKFENETAVICNPGLLILKKIQLEGKQEIDITEFVNGYPRFIDSEFF